MSSIEYRPAGLPAVGVDFPDEWGEAPDDPKVRRRWIKEHIRLGVERRDRGETVDWLAEHHE